ncbi:MAG: hypothetical protein J1E59_09490, partial [Treponema sp.]|nr:hypothetical protein [Treponema sp.]
MSNDKKHGMIFYIVLALCAAAGVLSLAMFVPQVREMIIGLGEKYVGRPLTHEVWHERFIRWEIVFLLENIAFVFIVLALSKEERSRNLRSNWYVVLSMLALGVLSMPERKSYGIAFPFSALAIVFAASQWHGLFAMAWHSSKKVRALSAVSTFGYAAYIVPMFVQRFVNSSILRRLFGGQVEFMLYSVGMLGAFAVFMLFCLFWRLFLREAGGMIARALRSCSRAELAVYALLCVATLVYVAVAFVRTGIFYGKGGSIYSADSWMLPNGNAFLHLAHNENDLRQPLFAVFTAP